MGYIHEPIFKFIKGQNIIVDVLHLFLRVSDRLMSLLHEEIEQMDLTWSNKLEEKKNFLNYINFLKSLGIKKPYYKENDSYQIRNFNGGEKISIFQNIKFEIIFPKMKNAKVRQQVWDNFLGIIFDIKDNVIDHSELKLRTDNFIENLRKIIFTDESISTPYIHIFISHLYKQTEYLSSKGLYLNDFSMQGIEKMNDFITKYYQRSSNKKGDFIKQVLQKRSRIEILHHHDNLISILDI